MAMFDKFAAYDSEKDVVRFRCQHREQMVWCAVTRAALVLNETAAISTRAELLKLYEVHSETIQRAVLNRMQADAQACRNVIVVGVDDVYHLKKPSNGKI